MSPLLRNAIPSDVAPLARLARETYVAAFGHTDEPPVRCFRFIYSVSRAGVTQKVSERISPATATACDETSEQLP